MASVVNICNTALAHIKVVRIDSLNEASEAARTCKLFYDSALEAVLRDFNWNFASKIIRLALVDEEIPGWLYIYQYPADCLHVRRVFNHGGNKSSFMPGFNTFNSDAAEKHPEKYKIMLASKMNERRICCNISNAYIEYTAKIKTPEVYDAKFIEMLAWKLAADICMPLTANVQLTQMCGVTYSQLKESAKMDNANEGYEEIKKPYDYINARW